MLTLYKTLIIIRDAAQELATLTNCTKEVIAGLAELATSPLAFGNPKNWTSLHVMLLYYFYVLYSSK